ncbi:MAG: PilZ domain-containing protein [Thermoanaerobaculia bacterium]|nr:PilZ domain-containing protein [Thermoanaerobaculia bacterium]
MASPRKPNERRRSPRRRVDGVTGSFLLSSDAKVLNISIDGMAIEAVSSLKVGRDYSLKLTHRGASLPLVGKVVWCSLVRTQRDEWGEVQPVYRAGLHFEKVLESSADQLQTFILENAMVSLEKRLFGRFRLQTQQEARVECEAEFRVLQLSVSGMLIETDVSPPVDSTHRMEVRFPSFEFATLARIVRSERTGGEDGSQHRLGIEFVDPDEEVRDRLEEFILSELT